MDAQTVEVTPMSEHHAHQTTAERKAALIRQGEFYRVSVVHAKAQVKHAARPEQLFHSAVNHASGMLRAHFNGLLKPSGTSVSAIMPYAMALIGFIRKRRVGKASLGVALALAGIGWYLQQRREQHASSH
jgi:hypothetical protein